MTEERGEDDSQLQIWESAARRQELGTVEHEDESWEVHVVVEKEAPDLVRGRLAFRRGDDYLLTAPVVVEETEAEVVRRAEDLPDSMIRQFLVSVRG